MVSAINLFIKNLNSFKKNIKTSDNKQLIKKLINSKKVRKQIIQLKQDVDRPDFGR
jgi:prephenate dehydrogenase/cyclohexadieny/prephenate dehydrogenase